MNTVLNQIKESSFSKKGKTTLTGQFEGKPANEPLSFGSNRDSRNPDYIRSIQELPVDLSKAAPTYLEYLKAVKKI